MAEKNAASSNTFCFSTILKRREWLIVWVCPVYVSCLA